MNRVKSTANTGKRRVAVLFPGALGDFVCLLPAINVLAEGAEVQVFARSEFAPIVPEHIRVSALERYEINRLFVKGAALEQRVRELFAPYSIVYSWMGSNAPVFSAELAAVAPLRVRLFAFRGTDPGTHQTDYYLSCLGLSREAARAPEIPLRSNALEWRSDFFKHHQLGRNPLLVLAPGSGAREKNWPSTYFTAIGRWWRERIAGEVIVLLGPAEQERGGLDSIHEDFVVAQNLNLAQAAALLSASNLFVGNDSGITHLAAAAGAPSIAIFGPSDPRQWAPRGPNVSVFRLSVPCSPCETAAMKACPHRQCLVEFSPLNLIEHLEKIKEVVTLTRGGCGITVQPL
ncbi:MAG TPA: glycosyltransferase family 9 protein [Gammaproteobacteria bacterium]|nr:glycosyltransferase family 9 protein [Gammaproteobacteria bacterium]